MTEACDLPWYPRGLPWGPLHAAGLEICGLASCWPLGQPEYRTGVSPRERLRKAVSGCGGLLTPSILLVVALVETLLATSLYHKFWWRRQDVASYVTTRFA